MDYKLITKNNIKLHMIETNRFKELHIVLYFTKLANSKDVVLGNLLCSNLAYSSKKYNTKMKLSIKSEELYGAKIGSSFGFNGQTESIIIGIEILNPKYAESDYTNEALDYLSEIVFNPNVENNHFNNKFFNIIKKDYINYIRSVKHNPKEYSNVLFDKIMYKNTPPSYAIPKIKDVMNTSSTDLYKYYKSLFDGSYNIDIVVCGEDINKLKSSIIDRFKNIKCSNNNLSFDVNQKYSDKVVEKIVSSPFNQSRLLIGYRLNNLNYHELNHVLKVYNVILGSMNDSMLFNNVREKYSLCYSVHSTFIKYNPSIVISAGINKKNYEESKKRIFETMELMKDRDSLNRLFNQAKETINTYINGYYDNIYNQINYCYEREYDKKDSIEELRKEINSVTIEEIIDFNNKLSLSTIFLLKGDNE